MVLCAFTSCFSFLFSLWRWYVQPITACKGLQLISLFCLTKRILTDLKFPQLQAPCQQIIQRTVPANVGISPEMAAFIAQTVQTAIAAEQESLTASANASVTPSSGDPPSPAVVSTSGGIPASLSSSATSFLAAGGGAGDQLGQGRPAQSVLVPSLVSKFANPSMSPFVSTSTFVSAPQAGATRDAADRSNVLSVLLLDQPFVVGAGFSPLPAKLVTHIVSGKYVDLSELLVVNLVQKEPEPQLLLDGRLVLTSQPKQQRWRIEDIASWMKAFAIFSLILVTHFPHRWKDLMQYQLLILRTFCHFSGTAWLAYDQTFHKHAAITRLTDWSCMNVKLSIFTPPGRPSDLCLWLKCPSMSNCWVCCRQLLTANRGIRGIAQPPSPRVGTLTDALFWCSSRDRMHYPAYEVTQGGLQTTW